MSGRDVLDRDVATSAIPQQVALGLQLAMIAGNEPAESFLEVRCLRPDGRPGPRRFLPIREHQQAAEVIAGLRVGYEVLIGVAPRTQQAGTADAVARAWCVWVDCDGAESVARLRRFLPRPSIVLRSGTGKNLHGYWPLRAPLPPSWARAANRRLAHALGSDAKVADPARVMRAIGTVNQKHHPVPVVCVRAELDIYTVGEVVGHLPDPPQRQPKAPRPASRSSASPSAALAGLAQTIRAAKQGNRNAALHWCACRVADHAAGGLLDLEDGRDALREAALAAGLGEVEVDATLRSALQRGGAE